ncbi:hypothetical protein [Paraburkholderia caledonica]|uniref:hypothetical protein n=1 Tax=Paraburkholderia caledonica TaxID=134536 RepID=UPI000D76FD03
MFGAGWGLAGFCLGPALVAPTIFLVPAGWAVPHIRRFHSMHERMARSDACRETIDAIGRPEQCTTGRRSQRFIGKLERSGA